MNKLISVTINVIDILRQIVTIGGTLLPIQNLSFRKPHHNFPIQKNMLFPELSKKIRDCL